MTMIAHITHMELPLGIALFALGVVTGVALSYVVRLKAAANASRKLSE